MATLLGLEVGYALQTWSHGRFAATVITTAAMALEHGLTDCALCVGGVQEQRRSTRLGTTAHSAFFEGMREGGGPHAETPWRGLAAPVAGAAMATRRYLHRYGVDREKLGAVADRAAARGGAQPARGDARAADAEPTTSARGRRRAAAPARLLRARSTRRSP